MTLKSQLNLNTFQKKIFRISKIIVNKTSGRIHHCHQNKKINL